MRSVLSITGLLLLTSGCYDGFVTETLETSIDRDLSGIAGPPDLGAVRPLELIPREVFGSANTADALAFPGLDATARADLFDGESADTPIHFFITAQSEASGLGPLYNQNRCLGCHVSGSDNAAVAERVDVGDAVTFDTAVARGSRSAVTDQTDSGPSRASTSFTLFGDYDVDTRRFDGLESFGGPVRHLRAADGCIPDSFPPVPGGEGVVRVIGERNAPSYVGRGLMEAIFDGDIERFADPDDDLGSLSTREPVPACDGDCISGRAVIASSAIGGDTILRVARFGLRGTTPTLIEAVAAGAQRDLGFSHPLGGQEEQNPHNSGLTCDVAPDPELTADHLLALRDFVRNLAPPELAPELLDGSSAEAEQGARLFGVDLDAFASRMREDGDGPIRLGDEDADRGIAADRQLNCVGCHTPIMVTGISPAKIGGAELSHRWVPLFSDLLVHHMGTFPADIDVASLEDTHPFFAGVSRNLADYALTEPGVDGGEWRTAPLLAFGKVGPPYLHDGRVFLNPSAPAYFYYGSRTADEAQLGAEERRIEITNVRTAIQAAIELHDLPQPPDANLDGTPDYDLCPPLPAPIDWCHRESHLRGEARNVIEKWHALTDGEQASVITFLMAL